MSIRPPVDAIRVETPQGSITLWRLQSHVLYHKVVGHLGGPLWRELVKASESVISEGHKMVSFCDWREMTGYDAEARTELTIWSLANKSNVEMTHILVRHKVVAMGVSVAGALVRNLKAYSVEADFEAEANKFASGQAVSRGGRAR